MSIQMVRSRCPEDGELVQDRRPFAVTEGHELVGGQED
jgi:hypothetical protein